MLAARLGKECAAKNLGDLFCGKEVALPEKQLSKQTAAYWYDKDKSDNSKQEYKTLMQEGHEYVCQAESITNTEKRTEAIKWVFPYLCDPAFGPESPGFLIFDWSDFTDGPVADSIPENLDSEIRYLPESLNDFFKAYKELSDSLAGVSGWDESMIPLLDKEDFFPYLSITNFRKIANMSYEVWYSLVKHGKGEWLEQHKDELEKLTLMETDWEKILDFAEKCPDTDLQMVLICLVETCYEMDNAAETYWKLFALNRLVENSGNEDCRLPDYFVKDFADRFSTGTEVLPRSHAIASRLYRQVIHMPGAEESLKRLSNL